MCHTGTACVGPGGGGARRGVLSLPGRPVMEALPARAWWPWLSLSWQSLRVCRLLCSLQPDLPLPSSGLPALQKLTFWAHLFVLQKICPDSSLGPMAALFPVAVVTPTQAPFPCSLDLLFVLGSGQPGLSWRPRVWYGPVLDASEGQGHGYSQNRLQ